MTRAETKRLLLGTGLDTPRIAAFAAGGVSEPVTYNWHSHRLYQLIYAFEGTLAVEAQGRRNLLPAGRAALIPALLAHRTVRGFSKGPGRRSRIASVFFKPPAVARTKEIVVFPASALLGGMMEKALAWGPGHEPTALSKSFFRTLGLLCAEWISNPSEFWLPDSTDAAISEALRWVERHLEEASEARAAAAAGMSVRTFRRQFSAATGMAWREYITRARLLHAAEQLVPSGRRSVSEIAWSVGYRSAPAFASAFQRFTGQTPGEYRRQLL